ncbi:MAG TPA: TRAP transporter large permease subunit, partial [Clostridia bacterium]|nr:TRAP transporter large permease subunit [Clostridia bacterium]
MQAIPSLLVPVIILVGMFTGIYTPTETAAIAVLYTIFISVFVYKNLKLSDIPRIIRQKARSTGSILFVAITVKPACYIFELDGLAAKVAQLITQTNTKKIVIMFLIFIFLIIVGMFMDATAAICILVPILL